MRGIADDSLIQITDLNVNRALGVRNRAQIADMTVSADPHCRARRHRLATALAQPLVELQRIAAHIGMGRACHLQLLTRE